MKYKNKLNSLVDMEEGWVKVPEYTWEHMTKFHCKCERERERDFLFLFFTKSFFVAW